MTTPNINTPYSIITAAMSKAGKLNRGSVPNGEQFAQYMQDLQRLIVLWQTQGLKLWLQTDLAIPLVVGKGGQGNPYTLSPTGDVSMAKPLRVQQGYFLDASASRRPIYPLSWDEWLRLSQTTQQGAIAQYFVDKQATSLNVYFWLVPDVEAATGTAHLMLQQRVMNPISLVETMNFPEEWGIALVWGLADEISTGQPQAICDRCQQRAAVYRAMLEDFDVEDAATSFAPDMRQGMGYSTGGFR